MTERFIKLTTDNHFCIVSIPEVPDKGKDGRFNAFVHQELDCDTYELVYIPMIHDQEIVMLVDESGLLNGKSANLFPWFLYSGLSWEAPIVGDVLFVGTHRVGELNELDFRGLTQQQIDYMTELFRQVQIKAEKTVG